MGFGMGFDLMSAVFPVLFILVFCLIFGAIIASLVRSAKQNRKNDASPRLDVAATVRSRRTHHYHDQNGFNNVHYNTTYFVTFEFPSGDRTEFSVSGQEYGMLCEGDRGTLHFQGTRYLGFTRA